MKIFHVSDTHLGYTAYSKIDSERGLNQREADFNDAFERFVDASLRDRPSLVIHTGDLFDSVRPSNRAISFAMEQIRRLSEAGIGFVAISGNHETPRLSETGSVFRILEHLENCDLVYEGDLKIIDKEGVEILALPHTNDERFKEGTKKISEKKSENKRIVMMHTGVVGLGVFRTNEINELLMTSSEIDREADYVALGHYHNFVEITDNCCYAGSTERASISEAGVEKGYVSLDLERNIRKFMPIKTRKMIDMPTIDVSGSDAASVKKTLIREIESRDIDGAILRMTLSGLSRDTQRDLDMNSIRRQVDSALNFELKIMNREEEQLIQSENPHIGRLEEEFSQFLQKTSAENFDKKRLEKLALDLFARGEK
ncbi:MAG: DNA repair exonuclease [Thermoplasmata archaeon]|nr:DNA repair exonuclease [Thermoplasmata archaeon]